MRYAQFPLEVRELPGPSGDEYELVAADGSQVFATRGSHDDAAPMPEDAKELVRLANQGFRAERLEVVIYGIRRMAESECQLQDIIDVCKETLPEEGD